MDASERMKPRARRARAMLRIRRREQRLYFRHVYPVLGPGLGPLTGFDLFLMYRWGAIPSESELLDRIFPDRRVAPDRSRGHE